MPSLAPELVDKSHPLYSSVYAKFKNSRAILVEVRHTFHDQRDLTIIIAARNIYVVYSERHLKLEHK